jgi:hypothetical protein
MRVVRPSTKIYSEAGSSSAFSAFGTFFTHLFLFFTFHFLFFSLRGEDGQNGEVDVGRDLDVSLQLEVFDMNESPISRSVISTVMFSGI